MKRLRIKRVSVGGLDSFQVQELIAGEWETVGIKATAERAKSRLKELEEGSNPRRESCLSSLR